MVERGFAEEAAKQANRYGWDSPGLQAPGYKAFRNYAEGRQTLEAAMTQFVRNDLHLAKRQRTWFKRNKSVSFICNEAEAVEFVTTWLNKLA
jgi:tRNA dimethylallyltransferase